MIQVYSSHIVKQIDIIKGQKAVREFEQKAILKHTNVVKLKEQKEDAHFKSNLFGPNEDRMKSLKKINDDLKKRKKTRMMVFGLDNVYIFVNQ